MNYYYIDRNHCFVGFDYDTKILNYLKSNKWVYNAYTKEWHVELNGINNYDIDLFLKNNNFTNGQLGKDKTYTSDIKELISHKDISLVLKSLEFKRTPRDYQIDGIYYGLNSGNFINGDACGLGKTAQSLLTVELLDSFPTIIVCPASVKYGWLTEWSNWNDRSVQVYTPKTKEFDADVLVINYEQLGKKGQNGKLQLNPIIKNVKWQAVIFDEIHFLKNRDSQRTKLAKQLVKSIPTRIGLSGTLAMNKPSEIRLPFEIIGRWKDLFESSEEFNYRYCNEVRTRFGINRSGALHLTELNNRMKNSAYIRREKRDVLTDLPTLQQQFVKCETTNKTLFTQAWNDLVNYLKEHSTNEKADKAKRAEALVKESVAKKLSIEGKMKSITDFLSDWKESNSNDKMVVFGTHKEPLKTLGDKFDCDVIQGGCTAEKKKEIIDDFKTNSKPFLFCSIDSAGTGVDGLQYITSYEAFIELPNRPSDLEQAIARVERNGQKNAITIYYLLSDNQLDTMIWERVYNKQGITDTVNKGIDQKNLSKNLIDLFAN